MLSNMRSTPGESTSLSYAMLGPEASTATFLALSIEATMSRTTRTPWLRDSVA
jgi:hypothetical protein